LNAFEICLVVWSLTQNRKMEEAKAIVETIKMREKKLEDETLSKEEQKKMEILFEIIINMNKMDTTARQAG